MTSRGQEKKGKNSIAVDISKDNLAPKAAAKPSLSAAFPQAQINKKG